MQPFLKERLPQRTSKREHDRPTDHAPFLSFSFLGTFFSFSKEKKVHEKKVYRFLSASPDQKNSATVPGPVWQPMTPPMG